MNTIKYVSLMLLLLVSIMGCSGNYGKINTQSESDSKVTQQELIDNWAEYNIYYNGSYYNRPFKARAIVFDLKNDDRKILVVGNSWGTVKDQESWMEIENANTTSDGDFDLSLLGTHYPFTYVAEIWSPDNQLYGFIIHQSSGWVDAKLVDENTMHLSWQPLPAVGNPK